MSKGTSKKSFDSVIKRTCQGGRRPKTSAMNKTTKSSFKRYRGQGR